MFAERAALHQKKMSANPFSGDFRNVKPVALRKDDPNYGKWVQLIHLICIRWISFKQEINKSFIEWFMHEGKYNETYETWVQSLHYMWGMNTVTALHLRHECSHCTTCETWVPSLHYMWDMNTVTALHARHECSHCTSCKTWVQSLHNMRDMSAVTALHVRHQYSHCTTCEAWVQSLHYMWDMGAVTAVHVRTLLRNSAKKLHKWLKQSKR